MKFNFQIIKHRKKYIIFSSIMVIASLIFFSVIPLNLSVDFKGGELLQLQFKQSLNKDKLNNVLEGSEKEIPQLNARRLQYSEGNTIVIRTEQLQENQKALLKEKVKEQVGEFDVVKNDAVGPTIGKELAANALKALGIGAILIIIYVTIRFEFVYAIAGLIALLHDVIITAGLIALFKFEINTPFIAAILTILGYSINDTIVVFDRIRENEKRDGKTKNYAEIIDESVSQVFVRSMYTSITTTISVLMLLIFGGETLKTFSMALFIGMIFGTYSSIFLASPLVYVMRKFKKNKNNNKPKGDSSPRSGKMINGYDEKDKVLV